MVQAVDTSNYMVRTKLLSHANYVNNTTVYSKYSFLLHLELSYSQTNDAAPLLGS